MSDKIPSLVELLKTGAHFGHQASKWHPKMEPFLFGKRGGIHIINLEKTAAKLQEALDAARDICAKGGTIVFLGTKRQARDIVEKHAKEAGAPYITGRWLGGTFTNFAEIKKIINKLNDFRAKRDKGEFEKYTKKERLEIDREIEAMEEKVGGISSLTKLPEAMFVIDIKHEKTAVTEANLTHVPIFALLDSNVNPDKVAYGIPSNDDAVKAIDLMTGLFAAAVKEGREKWEKEVGDKRAQSKAEGKPVAKDAPTNDKTAKILTA